MKKILLIVFLASSLMTFAQSNEKNFIDQNYIEVVGRAQLDVVPDMIYLNIVLSEKDNKKPSLTELEASMKNKLKELGIDLTKDLSINDYTSNFKSYFLGKDVVLTKKFQLVVHDVVTLQKVFLGFQKLDISNVTIDHVDHSKMTQYRKEVKTNAVRAAKEKAEALATALGQTTGRAIYILEQDYDGADFQPEAAGRMFMKAANAVGVAEDASDAGLDFQKIRLSSNMLVRFELK